MARGDYYFSQGILKGLGSVFLLKVLQEAPAGSPPRRLLGSFVNEVDYGLFGIKRAPGLEHSWDPEYFLKIARALPGWAERELVLQTDLAGFSQSYKIETKAGAEAKGAFPGAPVSAGLEIDYQRLRQATVTLGPGSKKLYIPDEFVPAAYRKFAAARASYDDILFDDDHMLVTQIVVATDLKIDVQSQSDFSAEFEAKASQVSGLGGGINYKRTSERSYALSVSGGKEYLFAIGAVQADKLK
jgi:hypothetical protein